MGLGTFGVDLGQGSAILSESVRNRRFQGAWNRYRNRIMPIPGIGIGLGIGPVLDKVSVSESGPKILKSGPILCKYRYKRSLLSYLWTSPYKGKGIIIRIYQQLPESSRSQTGIFSNRLFYCDPAGCQQMAPLNKATRCPGRAKLFFLHCDPDTYALYICLKEQSCRDHQKSEKLSNCKNNKFSLSII